jgi:hypothetical protein
MLKTRFVFSTSPNSSTTSPTRVSTIPGNVPTTRLCVESDLQPKATASHARSADGSRGVKDGRDLACNSDAAKDSGAAKARKSQLSKLGSIRDIAGKCRNMVRKYVSKLLKTILKIRCSAQRVSNMCSTLVNHRHTQVATISSNV